jgi:hypothetical protein
MRSFVQRLVCTAAIAVMGVALAAPDAMAQDKGSMRVAFGDVPGGEMVNFMIAVARAEERGVKVETSFLQSEELAAQAVVSGQADIGVGTPYALIQKVNAPIRMFYQLSMLRFFPVVNLTRVHKRLRPARPTSAPGKTYDARVDDNRMPTGASPRRARTDYRSPPQRPARRVAVQARRLEQTHPRYRFGLQIAHQAPET